MYSFAKRGFDIVFSIAGIMILSPFLLPIIVGLSLTGEGYVWYRQKRIGYKNKEFNIWKFATMLKDSPNMLTGSLTLRNDPRVTPMGGILRRSKLNELPQLFNVLAGSMSFVGPRPQMEEDFKAYPHFVQERIYDLKPGITSIGSIVFRDEEALISNTSMTARDYYVDVIAPYKGELEIWYQGKASFLNDMIILFLTMWVVFVPESALPERVFPDMPKRDLA